MARRRITVRQSLAQTISCATGRRSGSIWLCRSAIRYSSREGPPSGLGGPGPKLGLGMTDHLRELLTWLATGSTGDVGSTPTALRSALKWASALAITLIYCHYLAVLGGSLKGEGTPKRQAYDDMRHSLAHGNWAARVYAVRPLGSSTGSTAFLGTPG